MKQNKFNGTKRFTESDDSKKNAFVFSLLRQRARFAFIGIKEDPPFTSSS